MDLPIPNPTTDSRPYWDAAQDDRLIIQRCSACGSVQSVPRSSCGTCHSEDMKWEGSVGRGVVASYSVVHRGPTSAFRERTPYVLALVDLDESLRLMVNVVGHDCQDVQIGDAVEFVFEPRGAEGFKMPQARRKVD